MCAVLITGATGFLGSNLAKALHAKGRDVYVTGRNRQKLATLPVPAARRLALELAQPIGVKSTERLKSVRQIVHCAALSSPWGRRSDFEVANVTTTQNVLNLAADLGVDHLIFISSPSVYFRFADQIDVAEDHPLPPPVNAYAQTKTKAEALVTAAPVASTILRPRGLYGQGDTTLLPRLLHAAKTGALPLFRGGQPQTDITHISDVVSAIACILDAPGAAANRIFNISGGDPQPITEIVERACAYHNIAPVWKTVPLGPALAFTRLAETIARLRPNRPEPRATAYGLGIFAYTQTLDLTAITRALPWQPQLDLTAGLAHSFGQDTRP
ncbi:NAD-dependent epimerase/dehydratase family protein [Algirhabdus cladophorae]|uniref:NAD-dependent epimerase/dehydratase family protein n=1 Tax=Algirhabdus cladophorae TaxID=3377108 RepID=UPI003B84A632